jgi:hypothetical protein
MSDEDEEITTKTMLRSKGVVVDGEAPESDEEEDTDRDSLTAVPSSSLSSKSNSSSSLLKSLFPLSTTSDVGSSRVKRSLLTKYSGLLHRRLFDSNMQLRKQLIDLSHFPYKSSLKEMQLLTNNMMKTRTILSESSSALFRLKDTMIKSNKIADNILAVNGINNANVEVESFHSDMTP